MNHELEQMRRRALGHPRARPAGRRQGDPNRGEQPYDSGAGTLRGLGCVNQITGTPAGWRLFLARTLHRPYGLARGAQTPNWRRPSVRGSLGPSAAASRGPGGGKALRPLARSLACRPNSVSHESWPDRWAAAAKIDQLEAAGLKVRGQPVASIGRLWPRGSRAPPDRLPRAGWAARGPSRPRARPKPTAERFLLINNANESGRRRAIDAAQLV